MANELEQELKQKKEKTIKFGYAEIRVWDDGVLDARYFEFNDDGRGAKLKVPLFSTEEFLTTMRSYVHSLLDGMEFPKYCNYADGAESADCKPKKLGEAIVTVMNNNKVDSIFTEFVHDENRQGAPLKNSTLTEAEWKIAMAKEVGSACRDLKLTLNFDYAKNASANDAAFEEDDDYEDQDVDVDIDDSELEDIAN